MTSTGDPISSPPASGRGPAFGGQEDSLDQQLNALLSSNHFTVASYLNAALEEAAATTRSSGGDELQQRMAQLALQLQLQTQSCHEDIGRIGAELQAILPRCAADVGRVGVGLDGMRMDAASLLESTSAKSPSEEEVSTSLETLSTLHALQSNLSRTKDILTAAASWDSTLSSVAPLLAQQNLTEAVNALAQLENGERALRGMPHPEERKESIAKIRQQVQTLLQPQLKHALQNMNTRLAPLQQCVSLYMKLDKMDALKDEYVKNRPVAVHKAWFAYTPSYERDGETNKDRSTQQEFLAWLPGWYDAVLSLITEERRQSLAVFGHELVPEIIVKVLRECFRPILPSFQNRLESLYSSNPNGPTKGSLESICAVYEATLQFLSVIYENVAGGWLDMAEAGAVKGNGEELYKEMMSIFLQVASPFHLYQERFDALEAKHSGVATKLVANDIAEVIGSVSSTGGMADLATLQDATERLKGLSSFVFPLAEGALVRFELLNGGYKVRDALSTVDGIIAGHASKLASAVHSLSVAMTSDSQRLADNFDDQHVLCALEVLKIAGSFRRNMNAFESKTRERLSVLAERMSIHAGQQKKLHDTVSTGSTRSLGTSGNFELPDSLTVVDIDSYLTKEVCGREEGLGLSEEESASSALALLNRLAVATAQDAADPHGGIVSLYAEVDAAAKQLATSCHRFVFDVCSSVPRRHLSGVASMSAWKEEAGAADIASYGTLPQNYITHVGEHMLALVQALEPFASDAGALALANEVMGGVREAALEHWREFLASAGSTGHSTDVVEALMGGEEILDLVIGAVAEEDDDEGEEGNEASTAFCNAWLDAVGLGVTGRLLERIVRIPQLSQKGCEHLAADLNYLVNVFSALGLKGHPHPLLSHFSEIAALEGDILKQRISNFDRSDPVQAAIQCIEQRLALMRGVH